MNRRTLLGRLAAVAAAVVGAVMVKPAEASEAAGSIESRQALGQPWPRSTIGEGSISTMPAAYPRYPHPITSDQDLAEADAWRRSLHETGG